MDLLEDQGAEDRRTARILHERQIAAKRVEKFFRNICHDGGFVTVSEIGAEA